MLTLLAEQPLLMREQGSGTRAVMMEHLKAAGITPVERMTLGSNEAIKHAVAAGLGLSVVSRHVLAAEPEREGLAILSISDFPIMRQWRLVWRRDRRLPLAASVFVEHARSLKGAKS